MTFGYIGHIVQDDRCVCFLTDHNFADLFDVLKFVQDTHQVFRFTFFNRTSGQIDIFL